MRKGYFYRLIITRLVPFLMRHPLVVFSIWVIYLIIPVDMIPEAMTGFLGYFDDLLLLLASLFLTQKLKKRGAKKPVPVSSSPKRDPYAVLDLSPSASQEEILKAYRKRMAEYHPDKVTHLGKDLQETAHIKTREIQEAYETLKKNK
ncbi:hypothetical protein BVX98_01915 [bacterium F11]|nr:hypothetical protein BVX98_01915 [bacterium F11]